MPDFQGCSTQNVNWGNIGRSLNLSNLALKLDQFTRSPTLSAHFCSATRSLIFIPIKIGGGARVGYGLELKARGRL